MAEVFERLQELGAVAAVVPFHGGYDEVLPILYPLCHPPLPHIASNVPTG
jgi:hypothetical protein